MNALIPPLLFLTAGIAAGIAHFALLRRTADLLARRRAWAAPAALTLLRLALTAGVLAAAAWTGAPCLIAAFAGFLAARAVALRGARAPS